MEKTAKGKERICEILSRWYELQKTVRFEGMGGGKIPLDIKIQLAAFERQYNYYRVKSYVFI